MSYYAGYNHNRDHFILFDDNKNDLYIGDKKIKNVIIKSNIKKFKNENEVIFEISKKTFTDFINMNQYEIIDNIKNKNSIFLSQYDLEEWII